MKPWQLHSAREEWGFISKPPAFDARGPTLIVSCVHLALRHLTTHLGGGQNVSQHRGRTSTRDGPGPMKEMPQVELGSMMRTKRKQPDGAKRRECFSAVKGKQI